MKTEKEKKLKRKRYQTIKKGDNSEPLSKKEEERVMVRNINLPLKDIDRISLKSERIIESKITKITEYRNKEIIMKGSQRS